MTETRDALFIARNTEGRLVRRPLSPHLQVYRPQLTSVLSITHRLTGAAISVGTLMMTWWLVAAAASPAAYARVSGFMLSWFGLLLMFGWTLALFYHLLNGIRHLAWDGGVGIDLPAVHATGWAVVIGTVVLTLAAWVAGFLVL